MEGEEEEKMGSVCVQENIPDWTVLYHLRGGVGIIIQFLLFGVVMIHLLNV